MSEYLIREIEAAATAVSRAQRDPAARGEMIIGVGAMR
jgi:hypothetical protein